VRARHADLHQLLGPQSYSAIADGAHTFQVKATDAAGNTGTLASYTWTTRYSPR